MTEPTKSEWESKIDVYGNEIVRITMEFIQGKHTEEERNRLYREAGERHLATIRQAITAESERISEEVKGMAFVAINEAWEFAYHANGYNQAIEEVLDIINRYKE